MRAKANLPRVSRREAVERAAAQWAKDLTDESGRNRLLYYKDLKVGTLDLAEADPRIVDRLRNGKRVQLSQLFPTSTNVELLPLEFEDKSGDEGQDLAAEAIKRARAISRKAQENFEEKGIQTLFLGWGMATWTAQSTRATPAAPVLLCPIGLHRKGTAETDYDFELTGEWTLNEALLQHLANEFQVDVSGEDLMDPYDDGEQISPDEEQAIFAELSRRAGNVPGFAIVERLIAGNFMYKKMPMVNDIKNSLDALTNHDLIAALAGDEAAAETVRSRSDYSTDPSLPDTLPPADEFLVLNADSSQNAAINAALSGHSFVLQGPPGTGKSQTISNLISTAIARGMRVLFVAEKRAAIDAVMKRLTQVGLDGFVMDFHGGISSRRELAQLLNDSLTRIGQIPPVDHQVLHEQLESSRAALSGYADALRQPREPWGLTYFDVVAQLLELEEPTSQHEERPSPPVRFTTSVLSKLGKSKVREVRSDLKDWADLSVPLLSGQSSWADTQVTTENDVREVLDQLSHLIDTLIPNALVHQRSVQDELDLTPPKSVVAWGDLLKLLEDIDHIRVMLTVELCSLSLTDLMNAYAVLEKRQSTLDSLGLSAHIDNQFWDDLPVLLDDVNKTRESLTLEVFKLDLEQLDADLAPEEKRGLPKLAARILNTRYKKARSALNAIWQSSAKPEHGELLKLVRDAGDQAQRWSRLGNDLLPQAPAEMADAAQAHGALLEAIDGLARFVPSMSLETWAIDKITGYAQELLDDQDTLFRLPRLAELEMRLVDAGTEPLLNRVRDGAIEPNGLESAFIHSWLRSLHQEVLLADTRLSGFDSQQQNRQVAEFQKADARHRDQTTDRILRKVAEHAVAVCNRHRSQSDLIRREAQKKTRHMPLRRLLDEAPDVLTAVRPCWAMSPLDVAQTLPPKPLFDLVVFDEASQVLPCDAIPALLRGKQVMVAGDSHQLPPTTFFDSSDDGSEEADEEGSMSAYESILDVTSSLLRTQMLSWHYRSQDERLIAFSNQNIYHGGLTTFPGANSDHCLRHELIEFRGATTEQGSNSDEVARAVELMIEHAHERPDETLGVIAMGSNHANRIEEVLRHRLAEEDDSELEEFFNEANEERAFVKNLERVQGDERDAIILSIGYGKNATGRLLYNFGPLNNEGGERRLNVAITRARKRMTVVSSFSHAEMDPNRSSKRGVQMIRGYLKFAESGGTVLDRRNSSEPLNPFEIDVLNKLTAAGLNVIPQYGVSEYRIDFAVMHPTRPNQFALAVEADGASYHSSPTARDRDRLRQEHLEQLGWRFCRIWSTHWFKDHRHEVDRVLAAYNKAVEDINSGMVAPPRRPIAGPAPRVPAADHDPPTRAERPRIPRFSSITEYSHHQLVQLVKWIESDGLLRTDEELFGDVFEDLGFGRRGSRITDALNAAIDSAKRHNEPSRQPETLQTKRYTYSIVGERHYARALSSLMRSALSDKDGRKRREVCLQLVAQPYNQYDRNAISVQCEGKVLGHIARNQTMDFHRKYGTRLIDGVEVDGLIRGRTGQWKVKLDLDSIH